MEIAKNEILSFQYEKWKGSWLSLGQQQNLNSIGLGGILNALTCQFRTLVNSNSAE